MNAIVVDRLERRFGDLVALTDVSFEIAAGEVVALLGPNGAGRRTTLEILEGYLAPTAGLVSVLGEDPRRGGRAWRARTGVVLQSTSLDLRLTVRDSLALFSRLFPDPRPIPEMLELIGLEPDAQTRIGHLSGGSAAASISRSRSSADPSCCSSMSPRPDSTRRLDAGAGRSSSSSQPRARPYC